MSQLHSKSLSPSTSGFKAVIRALRQLDEAQKGERHKPEPKPKHKAEKPPLLALQAPLRALPKPGDST